MADFDLEASMKQLTDEYPGIPADLKAEGIQRTNAVYDAFHEILSEYLGWAAAEQTRLGGVSPDGTRVSFGVTDDELASAVTLAMLYAGRGVQTALSFLGEAALERIDD